MNLGDEHDYNMPNALFLADVLERSAQTHTQANAAAEMRRLHAENESLRAALAEPVQERNFCPRCGKRTNDIHTCTPPDSKHATIKQHKPLTTEEVEQLWAQSSWQGRANIGFARAIEKAHGIGV